MVRGPEAYVPTGKYDDYVMFASGGHGGQIPGHRPALHAYLEDHRCLRPNRGKAGVMARSNRKRCWTAAMSLQQIRWGDTHHPALSETAAEYDGNFLFINDKANARVAVIDLRDSRPSKSSRTPTLSTITAAASSRRTPSTSSKARSMRRRLASAMLRWMITRMSIAA